LNTRTTICLTCSGGPMSPTGSRLPHIWSHPRRRISS
jgi:hypothetical protein